MHAVRRFETDKPVFQREKREVAALTYVAAGKKTIPFLSDEDAARFDELSAEALHAQPLGIGIAPIFRAT